MCNALSGMLYLLRSDADTDEMIGHLRDMFLDVERVSEEEGHDITAEIASDPKHVIYYIAKYIIMLENSEYELMRSGDYPEVTAYKEIDFKKVAELINKGELDNLYIEGSSKQLFKASYHQFELDDLPVRRWFIREGNRND